jgi:hypothetical protein
MRTKMGAKRFIRAERIETALERPTTSPFTNREVVDAWRLEPANGQRRQSGTGARTRRGDLLFTVSASMRDEDDPRVVSAKLEEIVRSLRPSSVPFDPEEELQNRFEATHALEAVCSRWTGG